jgi:predicted RNase H-like HicB family nuclease
MESIIRGYRVVVEQADGNWSAYSPNLPGCITTGPTPQQTLLNMREAIDFHLEGLALYGYPIPPPYRPTEIPAPPITSR